MSFTKFFTPNFSRSTVVIQCSLIRQYKWPASDKHWIIRCDSCGHMLLQCYRCFEVACMATNLAHMYTDRNAFVHVPVMQYNDKPATSTSSQQWEYQTGCNVTNIKIVLKNW